MRNEGQEDAEAGSPGRRRQQGWLGTRPGRAPSTGARPLAPRFRLKRSLELFESTTGAVHLLRLGLGDDLKIEDPTEIDRSILTHLSKGFVSAGQLRRLVGAPRAYVADSLQALLEAGALEQASEPSLTTYEAERYDRQLIYFADLAGQGVDAQSLQVRLLHSHALLIGCGGLGSWVACGLACAGVGRLTLVDDDIVDLSNLNRQLLFTEADIGRSKVEAARDALLAHNRFVEVEMRRQAVRSAEDVIACLEDRPDIVIATADWPPHDLPRWVNAGCQREGIPWLGAGQFPPRLRIGPMVIPGRTPCLDCQEAAIRDEFPLYDEIADWRANGLTPDASVGPVTAVIGSLLAADSMHYLLGQEEPASAGRVHILDLQTMKIDSQQISFDPRCRHCH